MKKFLKSQILLTVLIFLAVVLDYFLDSGGMLCAGVGVVPLTVQGEPVTVEETKKLSPDLDADHISRKVAEYLPESTPVDTIMRRIGKGLKVDAFKTSFYAAKYDEGVDVVKAAVTAATAGNPIVEVQVDDIKSFGLAQDVLVQGVKGYNADGSQSANDLVLRVGGKIPGQNKLQVQAINGKVDSNNEYWRLCPDIPAGTKLVVMGRSHSELDAQSDIAGLLPGKDFNYCQIHMAQVEESEYQKLHRKEADWGMMELTRYNIWKMRRGIEYSNIFGTRSYTYDAIKNNHIYTAGGLLEFIPKRLTYGVSATDHSVNNRQWLQLTKSIFSDNNGSNNRVAIHGGDFMVNVGGVDSIVKQMGATETYVKWGIEFNKVNTGFGNLLFLRSDLFDKCGLSDAALVLDMNNVERRVFKETSVRNLELKASGQRNSEGKVIEESSCLAVMFPETHALLRAKE